MSDQPSSTSHQPLAISHLEGRGLPLRGDDIDTDRIMPARFLKAVSFEGLERHIFEDDRLADLSHPFNNKSFAGASMLIVNANFGCGSSREHAPQGLLRAGIRAIVGESFSEIFLGNSAMIGLPCLVGRRDSVDRLQTLIEQAPETPIALDVAAGVVTAGGLRIEGAIAPALRDGFLSGQWNPTVMLLNHFEDVRAVASRLPYLRGF